MLGIIVTAAQERVFREWARRNYVDAPPDLAWHPIVRHEWAKIAEERAARGIRVDWL